MLGMLESQLLFIWFSINPPEVNQKLLYMGIFLVKSSFTTQKFTMWILRTLYLLEVCPISLDGFLPPNWLLQLQNFEKTNIKTSRERFSIPGAMNSRGGWNNEAVSKKQKEKEKEKGKEKGLLKHSVKPLYFFLFRECGFHNMNKHHHLNNGFDTTW